MDVHEAYRFVGARRRARVGIAKRGKEEAHTGRTARCTFPGLCLFISFFAAGERGRRRRRERELQAGTSFWGGVL